MAVLILAAARTALGSFGGGLKQLTSSDLGSVVLRAVLDRSGLEAGRVAELVLGNVLQAGSGPNMARQAALKAGLPAGTPAMTLNQACGSGLRAVALAAQGLAAGAGGFALAGGAESMSNSPYLLPGARWGARMGATRLLDSVLLDGLGEGDAHPGCAAEAMATRLGLTRESQDGFAAASHRWAAAGDFSREIVPVTLTGRQGDRVFAADEGVRSGLAVGALAGFEPMFGPAGTVTAGNSAAAADGAAAVLLGTEAAGSSLKPIARILGFAQASADPVGGGPGSVPAIRRLLAKTGLSFGQVDRWELNETSAAHCLGLLAVLPEIDPARVNLRGGALALGHPLGAGGARILVTLLHLLDDQELRVGVAAIDAGGGLGLALAVERL